MTLLKPCKNQCHKSLASKEKNIYFLCIWCGELDVVRVSVLKVCENCCAACHENRKCIMNIGAHIRYHSIPFIRFDSVFFFPVVLNETGGSVYPNKACWIKTLAKVLKLWHRTRNHLNLITFFLSLYSIKLKLNLRLLNIIMDEVVTAEQSKAKQSRHRKKMNAKAPI